METVRPWIEDVTVKEIEALLTWEREKGRKGLRDHPASDYHTADGATLRSEVSSTSLRRSCPVQLLKVLRKDRPVQILVSDSAVQFKIQLHEDAIAYYESEIDAEFDDGLKGDILMLRRFRISITNIGPASERIQLLVLDLDYKSTQRRLLNTSDKLVDSPRIATLLEEHKKHFQTPHSSSTAPGRSGFSTNGDDKPVAIKPEPTDVIPSSQVQDDTARLVIPQKDQQKHVKAGAPSTTVDSTAGGASFVLPGPVQPRTNKRKLGSLSSHDLSQQAGVNLSQPYMGAAVQPVRAKQLVTGIRSDRLLSIMNKRPKAHHESSPVTSTKPDSGSSTNAAAHTPPSSSQMPRPAPVQTDRVDTSVPIGPASTQTANSTGGDSAGKHASNSNGAGTPKILQSPSLSHRQRQSQSTPRQSQGDTLEQREKVVTTAAKSTDVGKANASPATGISSQPLKTVKQPEKPARPRSPPHDPRRFATEPQSFLIPADQAELLDKAESWIPPPVGLEFPHPNVPVKLFTLWNEKQSALHREAMAEEQRQPNRSSLIQDRGVYQSSKSSALPAQSKSAVPIESTSEDDSSDEEERLPWGPSSPYNDDDRAAEQSGRRGKPPDSDDEPPSKVTETSAHWSKPLEQTSIHKSVPAVVNRRSWTSKDLPMMNGSQSSTHRTANARVPASSIASGELEEAVPRMLPSQHARQKSFADIQSSHRKPRSLSSGASDEELMVSTGEEQADATHSSKAASSQSEPHKCSSTHDRSPSSLASNEVSSLFEESEESINKACTCMSSTEPHRRRSSCYSSRQPLSSAPSVNESLAMQENEDMAEAQSIASPMSSNPKSHWDSTPSSRPSNSIAKKDDVQPMHPTSQATPESWSKHTKTSCSGDIDHRTTPHALPSRPVEERAPASDHGNGATASVKASVAASKHNPFGVTRPGITSVSTASKIRRSLPWSSVAVKAAQAPRQSLPAHLSSAQDQGTAVPALQAPPEQTGHEVLANSNTSSAAGQTTSKDHETTLDDADQNDQALTKIQEFAINWVAIKPGGAFVASDPAERPKWKINPLAWTR